ncbi:MAG: Taurine transporter permease [Hyphomicrobiales bacterium]|nr:Taurine transporter permease [Hyphomicrobiales bacterium]
MHMIAAPQTTSVELAELVAGTIKKRRGIRVQSVVLGLGFPIILLLIWEMAARWGLIDRRFFPGPSTIAASIVKFLGNPGGREILAGHVLATLRRIAIGFSLGATCGVAIGVIMGLHAPTRAAVAPLLYSIFPLPKIAIYPLMIIIFGLGDASSAALVTLGVFFMTSINTFSGVRYTNGIYHDVSRAFRFPRTTRWFRVFIPAAMPSIITGLRLGLGQALVLVISAEFVSADEGVGRFIWDSWQVLDIARMFMGLAVVLVFAGFAALLGNIAERRLIPWQRR